MKILQPPTRWMIPGKPTESAVWLFRACVEVGTAVVWELDYSMDEYGAVFLDGELVEYGPERGTEDHWHYQHLSLSLAPGKHELRFRVACFEDDLRPWAWSTVAHGLWVNDAAGLTTAESWTWRALDCRAGTPQPDWGQAPKVAIGVTETGAEPVRNWSRPAWRTDLRTLYPPELPPMRREPITDLQRQEREGSTVIVLPEYNCMNVEYLFGGTGTIEVRYYESPEQVGQPDKSWDPGWFCDQFTLDGHDFRWFDLWFRAGKAVEFRRTGTAELKAIRMTRTGYPWQFDRMRQFPEDERLRRLHAKAVRTLECCTENTYMDCPYYERMQYVSDSRIEMLTCYQLSGDRRLQRKALRSMGQAMRQDGALNSRYPSKDLRRFCAYAPTRRCNPLVPSFCFFYVQMLHDYAQLREDDALVRELLPTVRRIVAWAGGFLKNGILADLPGWNFIDWLPNWENGLPPGAEDGTGCTLNWIFVRALKDLADLERVFGTPGRERAMREMAEEITGAIERTYFVPERGLFAENAARDVFSEHAQVWALLAADRREVLPGLLKGDLDQCGICFSFYYLLACRLYGKEAAFAKRLERYLVTADDPALDTLPEEFVNWRSYCHAWSSHSLYFHYAPALRIFQPIGAAERDLDKSK